MMKSGKPPSYWHHESLRLGEVFLILTECEKTLGLYQKCCSDMKKVKAAMSAPEPQRFPPA